MIPVFTRIVATGQSLLSRCDSITVQTPNLVGFALRFFISATRRIISSNVSTQNPVLAETGIIGVSPPQSSGISHFSES